MAYAGLRHDVDTIIGLKKGVPRVVEIEESFNVKSTFFVRTVLLRDNECIRILKKIEDKGWEIGLHLDSTGGENAVEKALEELTALKKLGFNVEGATPHGGLIGFREEETWRVLDSLGLKYIQGYGIPPSWVKTKVLPPHSTLDCYVKKEGVNKGLRMFLKLISQRLTSTNVIIVSTHPEYFVFSVGSSLMSETNVARKNGLKARIYKLLDNSIKLLYTVTGYKRVDRAYQSILNYLIEKNIKIYRLRDLAKLI